MGAYDMRRWKYIAESATLIGVFASLHGGFYDLFRDTFFPNMKLTSPVFTALLSSLIICVLAFIIINLLGFLWLRSDRRRRQNQINAAQQWFNQEAARLTEGMKTLVRELQIELANHINCEENNKSYNWSGWGRLVEICELVKGSSGLYNIGSSEKVEKYLDLYPELWCLKEQRESIIQGLDRVYRFLSNSSARDIFELHKAVVSIEDVHITHIGQIQRICSRELVNV